MQNLINHTPLRDCLDSKAELTRDEQLSWYWQHRREAAAELSEHARQAQKDAAKRRVEKLVESGGLPPEFSSVRFDSIRVDHEQQQKVVMEAKTFTRSVIDKTNGGKNLLLMGGPGVGKSMIAAAISNHLSDYCVTTLWVNMPDLIRSVRDAVTGKSGQTESEIINSLALPDVLVIDEFGRHQASDFNKQFVWNLIFKRYELMKPIVATTNSTELELKRILDDAAVSRLADRGSKLMICTWPTYRGRV